MWLGDNAAALTLAERAIALFPIDKDALTGPRPLDILARVAARAGDRDRSISMLTKLLSTPYEAPLAANPPLTPALLRLDPMFEPLRKDPRFQKLVAVSPPK
jgi:serine/threonine-protein kinase